MWKKHKLAIAGFLAVVVMMAAGIASLALAQSGDGGQAPPAGGEHNNFVSRHVDYDLSLQVTGDLSGVDQKLQGVLPLNFTAKGGADIQPGQNGPEINGNLQLGGIDSIVQKIIAANGNGAQGALGGAILNGLLSNIQFTEIDHDLYLNLGGTWYDTGNIAGIGRLGFGHRPPNPNRPPSPNAQAPNIKPGGPNQGGKAACAGCLKGAFTGGVQGQLKDVTQVGTEDIDGVSTTHTSAMVDLDKVLTEAAAAARNCGKTDQANQIDAAHAQIVGSVKQLNIDWWIDGDGHLRQAKLALDVNPSGLASLAAARNPKAGAALQGITDVKLDATVKFSQFGQQFQISKPDGNITPLKNLLGLAGHHGQDGNSNGNNPAARFGKRHNQAPAGAST